MTIYARRAARRLSRVVFFFFSLFAARSIFARDIRVEVLDGDLGLPLEGAVVRTPDGKDWECGADGSVVVTAPEGSVTLRAAYPGYEQGRVVVPAQSEKARISLVLSGIVEGRELVVEAAAPRANETKPGRSVAISGQELARTAEIGVFEDVMNSVKLLPGVGYSGMFNSHPSIRGGDPGDLVAVFDGFYVENPYHFGGGMSIFDPRMVESAQLSHGIFSARYGHTISGILDITAKRGDADLSFLELGASSSAANINAAHPIGTKGAWMAMLKATYWAPFVWLAQGLSKVIDNEQLDMVNAISTAPYIISGAFSADYRFTPSFAAALHGYAGFDGAGGAYNTVYDDNELFGGGGVSGSVDIYGTWVNSLGFLMTRLTWNPRSNMVLGIKAGAGFNRSDLDGRFVYILDLPYDSFMDHFPGLLPIPAPQMPSRGAKYPLNNTQQLFMGDETDNLQLRADFDWDIGKGFILAAGVQELYSLWLRDENFQTMIETPFRPYTVGNKQLYINYPAEFSVDAKSHAFTTSGYIVGEWRSPGGFFEAEAGARIDTFIFFGKDDFSVYAAPAINPRLNMDFHFWKGKAGPVTALSLTLGTGLFSSMPSNLSDLQPDSVDDYELQPNRTWTSLAGVSLEFPKSWTLNIELYYKYVFSRGYSINWTNTSSSTGEQKFYFDGYGNVFGADLMLRKPLGAFVDGWLTYTFNYARYAEPAYSASANSQYRADGYFPNFQRFHNANLVLNFKISRKFNLYVRYGIASGRPEAESSGIDYYPVLVVDENMDPVTYIQKYKRISTYSDEKRSPISMPFDLKASWYFSNKTGRTTGEFYIAVENLASLFYTPTGQTTFNQYTGKEDTGGTGAVYELPIPMISAGMKWSF